MPKIRNNNHVTEKLWELVTITIKQTCSTFQWTNQIDLVVKKPRWWYTKFQEERLWVESET